MKIKPVVNWGPIFHRPGELKRGWILDGGGAVEREAAT